jgi:hypothetical protein
VIAIRSAKDWLGYNFRSFIVHIDGRRSGKVIPWGAGKFVVAPRAHTVAVSIGWCRSQPAQVAVGPGATTRLVIHARPGRLSWWRQALPGVVPALVASAVGDMLMEAMALDDEYWWMWVLVYLALFAVILAGYSLASSMLFEDHWVVWTLEPEGRASRGQQASGATGA